jgi:hypothetical protein
VPDPILVLNYLAALLDPDSGRRRERGMTTTEVAVITFLLVGAAIVVLGIIYAAASGNAENIPVPESPGP